ncbi:MAG: GAF domain-containing protein [Tepidisphaeraceae bacterium]|jgi:two-component sensor histidine kinase
MPPDPEERKAESRLPAGLGGGWNLRKFRWAWALPAILILVVIGLTFLVWHLQRVDGQRAVELDAQVFAQRLDERAQGLMSAATRHLRREWVAGHLSTPDKFAADVSKVRLIDPNLSMVGWVDSDGTCRQLTGGASGIQQGAPISADPFWGDLLDRARATASIASAGRIDAHDGPVFEGVIPGADGHSASSPGLLIFEFRPIPILNPLVEADMRGMFVLQLCDQGGEPFVAVPGSADMTDADPAIRVPDLPVRFLNHNWQLRVIPSQLFVQERMGSAPNWALWVWLIGTVLLIVSILQARHFRKLDEQRFTHHLQALESLAITSATILSKVGSSGEVWQRLPEATSSLLGMAMASVAVLEEGGESIRIVAQHGTNPPTVGRQFLLEHMPSARVCMETRKPVTIPDVGIHPKIPNSPHNSLLETYNIQSALQVPLCFGDRTLGILMLAHTAPRQFTASDIRLAELWGTLAAVTIANDQLLEETSRALEARSRLLTQRDALFGVINELTAHYSSTAQILDRIVELAPGPLEADLCQVSLVSEDGQELVLKAQTSNFTPELIGMRYSMDGGLSGKALQERRLLTVEDGGPDNPILHPVFRKRIPCGSILFAPLVGADGSPIGVLVVLRKKKGSFSSEQISMSQLLAVRAASAIENARLYQRTREDADAKAMLLRELNHRVKNNLAGIVALLSMDQPELSKPARKWLGRVIDRVRTLARTHEMLSGGIEHVSLKELVDQTIQSLAVVTPAGVKVRCQHQEPKLRMRTDRAVSVAMVLNELCYNALVHGLVDRGTLTVRAAAQPPGKLLLEVIDDGCGFTETEAGAEVASAVVSDRVAVLGRAHTGLGLDLVRDFVERELRGQFSIEPTPGGGTTARVIFPLREDEWSGPGL